MSLGPARNVWQCYNLHACLYQSWNVGEDQFRTCWDIGWDRPLLPYRFKSTHFSHLNLWRYWTTVYHICTRSRGIIFAIKLLIHIVIFQSVLKCHGAELRSFRQFVQNWLPWQRPLRNRKKLVQIDNIHANTFHLVKKNRENRSSRSWDSFAQI